MTVQFKLLEDVKLQNHWNNWFLSQKTVTEVITGSQVEDLLDFFAKLHLGGDKENKEQRNHWMAPAHEISTQGTL